MEAKLTLTTDSVTQEVQVGSATKEQTKELGGFFKALSEQAYFDTGLLPLDGTGTLALRQGLNHTQIVFQHAPGIYYIIWGDYEGGEADEVHVAQPYRIVIGDLIDGQLLGARHFYSPVPITDLDQPLYHCNVPNLNCKGYGGTSVGWICLYHTEDYSGMTLGKKVFQVVERASGHEAYNDGNMGETDGPRFYQEMYHKNLGAKANGFNYLWEKHTWQKKSAKEGFDWTLNPDLWIPVKVTGQDHQDAHNESGVVLTLRMAMYGKYNAYYNDPTQPKPVNSLARDDLPPPDITRVFQAINNAFLRAVDLKKEQSASSSSAQTQSPTPNQSQFSPPPQDQWQILLAENLPKGIVSDGIGGASNILMGLKLDGIKCNQCDTVLKNFASTKLLPGFGLTCSDCVKSKFFNCGECGGLSHLGFGQVYIQKMENADDIKHVFCQACHTVTICQGCDLYHLDAPDALDEYGTCDVCNPLTCCDSCAKSVPQNNVYLVMANVIAFEANEIEGTKEYSLCADCMSVSKICACGLIKNEDTCSILPTSGEVVCGPCVEYDALGAPVYVSIYNKPENQTQPVGFDPQMLLS